MRKSDNYELNLVEGSDIVNPLVQDVPNYEAIDAAMFDNKEHSVGVATELKTGTVHALTRQNEDAAVFRFTATSDYTAGDTFEVDGVQVSALLVDGTALPNRCYIIGSEVLASLKGTLLTVYANRTTASDSDKLGGQLPAYYATNTDLDSLEDVVEAHTNQINQINGDLANISPQMVKAVTSDGVKTYRQLISELYDSAILSKYRNTSIHIGNKTFQNVDYDNTHGLRYSGSIVYEDGFELETIQLSPSQAVCAFFTYDKNGFHTFSNTPAVSGTAFSLWIND